jgi:D-glycero-alpha-D-manno-heptose 1-phosphate guanylyltransferase
MKSIHLLVLAGGFGTRLRSVVSEVPKPLAPMAGKPFLHYLMQTWIEQGVTELSFLLHHQADLVQVFLTAEEEKGRLQGCKVRTLCEPQPMGTGGAIAYAVQQLKLTGSFLVTNADTWLGSGINEVFVKAAPSMATVQVENSERYGSLKLQGDSVIGFAEKQDSAGAGSINAGLYHLSADLFRDWDGQPFSIERQIFPKLAATGQLKSVPLQTDFIDIGVPEDYFRFDSWIGSGKGKAL